MTKNISIHAPRAGSDSSVMTSPPFRLTISIHAPRAGSDCIRAARFERQLKISIHAPRAGSDEAERLGGVMLK